MGQIKAKEEYFGSMSHINGIRIGNSLKEGYGRMFQNKSLEQASGIRQYNKAMVKRLQKNDSEKVMGLGYNIRNGIRPQNKAA